MRMRSSCRQVKTIFHRSFRRPVKIRVEAEPPSSVDRVELPPPAGFLLRSVTRPPVSLRSPLRVIRLDPAPAPDWRIVGDHDVGLWPESEVGCV